MRIARFTHNSRTRLGVVTGDLIADVGAEDPDVPADVGDLLARGGASDHLSRLARRAPTYSLDEVRLEAPIASPPAFLGVGLNYRLHADTFGLEKPDVPMVFNKQTTSVIGPSDPIPIPKAAPEFVDYEGELGVVIGRRCRGVPAARAGEVVAGYLVVNDVTVRDWQLRSPTMTMGKSWDGHGPTGPWMVTADEIDPHRLRLRTWVDDELRQDASTAEMIHDCWALIEHVSTAFTLLPGTIISTGTPAGVGFKMDPPQLLRAGQRVRVQIDGIGAIDNPVVDEISVS